MGLVGGGEAEGDWASLPEETVDRVMGLHEDDRRERKEMDGADPEAMAAAGTTATVAK